MKKLSVVLVFVALFSLLAGAAFAGKLEDIKSKGVLVAGVKDSQPPFGYVDEATKQIVGFEIDIMEALAKRLGVKLELKPVTSSTRIPMLGQGAVDIVAATMTHSSWAMPTAVMAESRENTMSRMAIWTTAAR